WSQDEPQDFYRKTGSQVTLELIHQGDADTRLRPPSAVSAGPIRGVPAGGGVLRLPHADARRANESRLPKKALDRVGGPDLLSPGLGRDRREIIRPRRGVS